MLVPSGMLGFGLFKIPAELAEDSRMANNPKLHVGIFFLAWALSATPMVFAGYYLKNHDDHLNAIFKKAFALYLIINAIAVTIASVMADPEGVKEKNFWATAHFAVGSLLLLPLLHCLYQKSFSERARDYDREPVAVEMGDLPVAGVPVEEPVPVASPVEGTVVRPAPGGLTLREMFATEEAVFPAPF